MKFTETLQIGAPAQRVAAVLGDPQQLITCLPNCREVILEGAGRFATVVEDRVGPFRVRLPLAGTLVSPAEGEVRVEAEGTDSAIGSGVVIRLALGFRADGAGTRVSVDADVTVRGKLASLGQPMFALKSREIMKQFSAGLSARLEGGSGS